MYRLVYELLGKLSNHFRPFRSSWSILAVAEIPVKE